MASYTSFLNLEKPTTSERLDVLKINSNCDKIDAGVSALNSQISYKTFNSSNYAESATQQITLPADLVVGQAYLVIFRHYTSTTTFTVDAMLLCPLSDSSVATAWIAKNSSATLSNTSVSGRVVTFTFSATAYCSIYFIKMK